MRIEHRNKRPSRGRGQPKGRECNKGKEQGVMGLLVSSTEDIAPLE